MDIWHVLTTEHSREFRAAAYLTEQGFKVFVPIDRLYRRVNRYAKRKILRDYPLIPGYVFLMASEAPVRWLQVLSSNFVRRVIVVDREPLEVDSSQMTDLLDRWLGGEFVAWSAERHMRSGREFKIGDGVEIVIGLLTGHQAEVVGIDDEEARAQILVEMLGSNRVVDVRLETLEAA